MMEIKRRSRFAELKAFSQDHGDLSLKEKLTLHFAERKNEPVTSPRNLNKYIPVVFVLEVCSLWYFGVNWVLPYFYSDREKLLIGLITLATFLPVEIFINWYCINRVESIYNPNIHGTQPLDFAEHKNEKTESLNPGLSDNTCNDDNCQSTVIQVRKYWVWGYCKFCDRPRPPRCHHCPLCETCVMKRDHHCFFARRCIGYHNLRHFTVFLLYCTFSTIYSITHYLPYLILEVIPNNSYSDVIPFVTFIRCLFGYGQLRIGIFILTFWFMVAMVIYCINMITENWNWILSGKTSFEIDNNLKLTNNSSKTEKLRAVFGDYWLLNFLFPLHTVFEPRDDPVAWPNINLG